MLKLALPLKRCAVLIDIKSAAQLFASRRQNLKCGGSDTSQMSKHLCRRLVLCSVSVQAGSPASSFVIVPAKRGCTAQSCANTELDVLSVGFHYTGKWGVSSNMYEK